MQNGITPRDEFLDRKRDYSPLLVHLTRENPDISAMEVLEKILVERTLRASNYYCLFEDKIQYLDDVIKSKFRVTCFTETPIDSIEILLTKIPGRTKVPEPYGLVFKKDYIRQKEGNPVFYVSINLFDTMWEIYHNAVKNNFSNGEIRFLALINKFDENFDFSWEREWRIVGDLEFELIDIYCGLCPEDDISYFESKFKHIIFISPSWKINKILDKMVQKQSPATPELPF